MSDEKGDQESAASYSKEREAGYPGRVSCLWDKGIQDRARLTVSNEREKRALPWPKVMIGSG
jgi:hypothetical protein